MLSTVGGATAGGAATTGTSTTSRPVSSPPYYRGDLPLRATNVGRLPVTLAVPHEGLPSTWIPTAALDKLATDLTAWLGRQDGTSDSPNLLALESGPKMAPPRVYLGCALDETGGCIEQPRQNVLEITSANRAWRQGLGAATRAAAVDLVLVLQLDLAPVWIHQRNLKGSKEVRLGTSHTQSLPWLTSHDIPILVLQLTGIVVDSEGKVVRSGAEGVWALRTPFRASVLGAQKLLTEEDVERIRTDLVREDLPGSPLLWQAAATDLVNQLLESR